MNEQNRKFRRPTRSELDDPTQRERVVGELVQHIEYLHDQIETKSAVQSAQTKALRSAINDIANRPEKIISTVDGLGGTLVEPQLGKAYEVQKLPATGESAPGQFLSLLQTDGANTKGLYVLGVDSSGDYIWKQVVAY